MERDGRMRKEAQMAEKISKKTSIPSGVGSGLPGCGGSIEAFLTVRGVHGLGRRTGINLGDRNRTPSPGRYWKRSDSSTEMHGAHELLNREEESKAHNIEAILMGGVGRPQRYP